MVCIPCILAPAVPFFLGLWYWFQPYIQPVLNRVLYYIPIGHTKEEDSKSEVKTDQQQPSTSTPQDESKKQK